MQGKLKTYLILFAGVFALSTSAIFVKLSAAPSAVTAFYRLLFAGCMLLPFFLLGSIAAGPFLFRSFVPATILIAVGSVISFIGVQFVCTYTEASFAAFYREICREKNPPQDPFQPESTLFETYQMPYTQVD